MMLPPILMKLRIAEESKSKFALWIPLVLFWPFLLLLLVIILPFYIIAFIGLIWTKKGRAILHIPFAFYELLCAVRGLHVDVNDKDDKVKIIIV